MKKQLLIWVGLFLVFSLTAHARPYNYPAIRYESVTSESMGGVTLPLSDDIGNALMNNPAALAKNTKFRAEIINLNLDANTSMVSNIGLNTLKMTGLSGMESSLNSNTNQIYGAAYSNMSAVAWGGLGIGLLMQERSVAYSDGTNIHYQTLSQTVPTIGYGFSLARGIVRVGYSFQYVNETTGTGQAAATDSTASFLNGLDQGHGFSQNASVNFVFPFTYLPTVSIIGRNLGGLHYTSGSLASFGNGVVGLPADEPTSVDASLNFTVRISGELKSGWYFQYKDMTGTSGLPFLEKLNTGLEVNVSKSVSVRAGLTGTQFSAGFGYKSDMSEINLAWYHEQTPFPGLSYWDTRYALQYKIYFKDKNARDRNSEVKGQ